MSRIPRILVGQGNQSKVIEPVMLVCLNSAGELTPVRVSDTGDMSTVGGSGGVSSSLSDFQRLEAADDLVVTYSYFDEGTADQRMAQIYKSSSSLGLYYFETFTYVGSTGSYRVVNVTRAID